MKRCLCRIVMLLLLLPPATVLIAADAFQMSPQGLLYKDLKPGSGETVATGDVVTIHFTGWLDAAGQKGKEIYNSHRYNEPLSFVVGTDRVMPGWNEGVTGMRAGGRRLLKVPPSLGYGSIGMEDIIAPDARLIFIIDLIDVEKHPAH